MIRSHQGELTAFASFYSLGNNNSAEFLALKKGMILRKVLNLSPVLIESDSMVVVAALRFDKMDDWSLSYVFRECLQLYTPEFEIVNGFHERNMVADNLAAAAYNPRQHLEFFQTKDVPRPVREAYNVDKLGLWNFRA